MAGGNNFLKKDNSQFCDRTIVAHSIFCQIGIENFLPSLQRQYLRFPAIGNNPWWTLKIKKDPYVKFETILLGILPDNINTSAHELFKNMITAT